MADRYEPAMINTGNPYVDNLVYYCKIFVLDTVLKDQEAAINNETVSSLKRSDIYIHCMEGSAIFDYFDNFPVEVIKEAFPNIETTASVVRSYFANSPDYMPFVRLSDYALKLGSNYGEALYKYNNGGWYKDDGTTPIVLSQYGIEINSEITPMVVNGDYFVIDYEDNLINYERNKYLLRTDLMNGKIDSPTNYTANMVKLITTMENYYIANYEEENTYYRMLIGLPPLPGFTNNAYYNPEVDDLLVNFESYFPPGLTFSEIDLYRPIYELSASNIELLDSYKLLEVFYESDDNLKKDRSYMRYIAKNIDLYKARRAEKFAPLYVPSVVTMLDDILKIRDVYIDRLNNKRLYILRTVLSDAFKYGSEYYDSFIAMLIVITAMMDTIGRVSEFIATKDIFDWRTIKYLLESYGVKYFEGMPIKYQINLVKNIQTILKEKSTAKCMKDILNIFGMTNIEIFRYYLVKKRKIDDVGNYIISLDADGNHILENEYDLAYLRVPIDDSIDKYVREPSSYISYEVITEEDPFWSNDVSAADIKQEVLEQNFNYVFSKYISIDSFQQVQEASNMQSYIFTILYDKLRLEEYLNIKVPYIDSASTFRLSDVFTFLTVLNYLYYDTVDKILENASDLLYLDGFNFNINKNNIISIIQDTIGSYNGYTYVSSSKSDYAKAVYEEAFDDANKYIIPGQLTSIPALLNVYDTNMNVRDSLLYRIKNANNVDEYRCFNRMYNALMKVKFTTEFFREPVRYTTVIESASTNALKVPDGIKVISDYQNKITIYKNSEVLIEDIDYVINTVDEKIYFTENLVAGNVVELISYKGLYVDPNEGVPTYTEYLKNRDLVLYNKIQQIINDYPVTYEGGVPNEKELEDRQDYIDTLTDQIIDTLSTYNLNITEYFSLFNGFSSSLKDMIQNYIKQVIDFFKSYKVQIYTFKQNYVVNNKLQSYIRPIDGLMYNTSNGYLDMYRFADDFVIHRRNIIHEDGINYADHKDAILDDINEYIRFTYRYNIDS